MSYPRPRRLVEKEVASGTSTDGPSWLLPHSLLVRGAITATHPVATILNNLLDAGWIAPNDPEFSKDSEYATLCVDIVDLLLLSTSCPDEEKSGVQRVLLSKVDQARSVRSVER